MLHAQDSVVHENDKNSDWFCDSFTLWNEWIPSCISTLEAILIFFIIIIKQGPYL